MTFQSLDEALKEFREKHACCAKPQQGLDFIRSVWESASNQSSKILLDKYLESVEAGKKMERERVRKDASWIRSLCKSEGAIKAIDLILESLT